MEREGLDSVETIDPTPSAPRSQPAFDAITIEQDKVQTIEQITEVMRTADKVIFTDASVRDSGVGAAVVMLDQDHGHQQTVQVRLGRASDWTVHAAELVAIHQATEMIAETAGNMTRQANNCNNIFTIVSDSQSAIQATATTSDRSGQSVVRRIIDHIRELRRQKVQVRLLWTPCTCRSRGQRDGRPTRQASNESKNTARIPPTSVDVERQTTQKDCSRMATRMAHFSERQTPEEDGRRSPSQTSPASLWLSDTTSNISTGTASNRPFVAGHLCEALRLSRRQSVCLWRGGNSGARGD